VGAHVDGKLSQLQYQLKTGQTVEVLTSEDQRPSRDWIDFLKTSRARSAVKHWIRQEETRRAIDVGRKVIAREIRRQGRAPETLMPKLATMLEKLATPDEDTLFAEVGYGKRSTGEVVTALIPDAKVRPSFKERMLVRMKQKDGAVIIRGEGVMVHLASCCRPIPGDNIVGHMKRGKGLVIHQIDCPHTTPLGDDPELLVAVKWDRDPITPYQVPVQVVSLDQTGILGKVSSIIAAADANISQAQIQTMGDRKARFNLTLEVNDTKHLGKVISRLERLKEVLEVKRVTE
jgi:GTP pyrophosphokinase